MKFKITTEDINVRPKKVYVYVNLPGITEGAEYTEIICAINKKELTPDVQDAITQAFKLGMEAQRNLIRQRLNTYNDVNWEETKDDHT